jgi:gamma-glutamyltranspeptidase/glutathione hydrolase
MRIFHHGNRLRDTYLGDPRMAAVSTDLLVRDDLRAASPIAALSTAGRVPRGDTVGIATADGDGIAVSLIQSAYYAFGSGLIDPQTGVLFHNRGTGFSLGEQSPNLVAPRKRPVHTLMPVMTAERGELRHVLATMGGQGQPQILTQVLLRMLDGASAADAVSAPRAIAGFQAYGCSADSVLVESDVEAAASSALAASGLEVIEVRPHTESLGQANVVHVDSRGQVTAAADPRADGSAVVAQFARHHRSAESAG